MDFWEQLIGIIITVVTALYGFYKWIMAWKKKRKEAKEKYRKDIIEEIQETIVLRIKDILVNALLEDTRNMLDKVKGEADVCMEKVKDLLKDDITDQGKNLEKEIKEVKESLNDALKILEEYVINKVSMDMSLAHASEKLNTAIKDIQSMREKIVDVEKNIVAIQVYTGAPDGK